LAVEGSSLGSGIEFVGRGRVRLRSGIEFVAGRRVRFGLANGSVGGRGVWLWSTNGFTVGGDRAAHNRLLGALVTAVASLPARSYVQTRTHFASVSKAASNFAPMLCANVVPTSLVIASSANT
jgi:hypothetical protein